ncbi:hypothetical protein [Aquimarina atlantica]|nr:hypothetical protein [Aquimarina atlantica]
MKNLSNKEALETNGGSAFPIPSWLQPLADYFFGVPKEEKENYKNSTNH